MKRAVKRKAGSQFDEVLALIEAARGRAFQAVNVELVGLYWQLGEYISKKIASAEWGDGVVDELAALARRYAGLPGFTRRNLFRMRQLYEAYRGHAIVSPLVTQLPWTHHLIILSQAKPAETREFYVLAAIKQRWTKRELERQIQSGAALRSATSSKRASAALVRIHPNALDELENAYSLELLSLPDGHSERDLHRALVRNLGRFITELGRDLWLRGLRVPGAGRQPGLRDRPRVLPPRARLPRGVRAASAEHDPRRNADHPARTTPASTLPIRSRTPSVAHSRSAPRPSLPWAHPDGILGIGGNRCGR